MIELGSLIRHIKRGSIYEVIGFSRIIYEARKPSDQCDMVLVAVDSIHAGMAWHGIVFPDYRFSASEVEMFRLPVKIQISTETRDKEMDWIIYRQTDGNLIFARHQSEFTPDRFEEL